MIQNNDFYIGIDPGCNGAACLMNGDKEIIDVMRFKDMTDADIADGLIEWAAYNVKAATIEQVNATPQMGVVSAFKFGLKYGTMQGLLAGLKIPYSFVRPQLWQKTMGCMTKGDKNVSKSAAQRLYPKQKITHADADAILIAAYTVGVHK